MGAHPGASKASLHVLQSTEFPNLVFSAFEAACTIPLTSSAATTAAHTTFQTCTVFDASWRALVESLAWTARVGLRSELHGAEWALGEGVLLRVGTLAQGVGRSIKSLPVQIHYTPCCVLALGWPILCELAEHLLGLALPSLEQYLAGASGPTATLGATGTGPGTVGPGPGPGAGAPGASDAQAQQAVLGYLSAEQRQRAYEMYEMNDTAQQYLEYFAYYRKQWIQSTGPGGASVAGSSGTASLQPSAAPSPAPPR